MGVPLRMALQNLLNTETQELARPRDVYLGSSKRRNQLASKVSWTPEVSPPAVKLTHCFRSTIQGQTQLICIDHSYLGAIAKSLGVRPLYAQGHVGQHFLS